MKKNWSAGVIRPSILRRSSKRLLPSAGLGLKVAGMSVKGTSTSPWASAGSAHSGTAPAHLPPRSPRLSVSRLVITLAMDFLL